MVIKSTVPVGYTAKIRNLLDVDNLIFSPEFLREGTAVYDYYNPPKTVIGETDQQAGAMLVQLYQKMDAPMIRTDVETLIHWKQRHQLTVIGASDSAPTDYQAVSYPAPVVVLLGAEQQGLSTASRGVCDTVVRIPMIGRSDSLNLAVATGVLLYEVFNQHRNRKA